MPIVSNLSGAAFPPPLSALTFLNIYTHTKSRVATFHKTEITEGYNEVLTKGDLNVSLFV